MQKTKIVNMNLASVFGEESVPLTSEARIAQVRNAVGEPLLME
jgi:hypothetical protein